VSLEGKKLGIECVQATEILRDLRFSTAALPRIQVISAVRLCRLFSDYLTLKTMALRPRKRL
jgi:hypothetical protein